MINIVENIDSKGEGSKLLSLEDIGINQIVKMSENL